MKSDERAVYVIDVPADYRDDLPERMMYRKADGSVVPLFTPEQEDQGEAVNRVGRLHEGAGLTLKYVRRSSLDVRRSSLATL